MLISDWIYGSCAPEDGTWTGWTSRDDPSGNYDSETTSDYRQDGNEICNGDLASSIEARVIETKADYTTTGQTVLIDSENGFLCDNNQNDPDCENYEIRFCCPGEFNNFLLEVFRNNFCLRRCLYKQSTRLSR